MTPEQLADTFPPVTDEVAERVVALMVSERAA